MKNKSTGIVLFIALLLSFVFLKYSPAPWAWTLMLWSIILVRTCIKSQNSLWKMMGAYLAATVFALALFEVYLWVKHSKVTVIQTPKPYVRNPLLGYALKKNITVTKKFGENFQWQAIYTIDEHGLRVSSSPYDNAEVKSCALFFGGSFTFGTAMQDTETLPSQVEAQSKGRIKSFNFGVPGYGPNQVLALLEEEVERDVVDCQPEYAILLADPHHIARVAGNAFWDKHQKDPRYEIMKNGEVLRTGTFEDANQFSTQHSYITKVWRKIVDQYKKSRIAQNFYEIYNWKRYSPEDIDLFVGILEKTKFVFEERYSNSQFLVVYWDTLDHVSSPMVLEKLKQKSISVYPIGNLLPQTEGEYLVARYENHPPPLHYQIVAEYLVKNVLKNSDLKTVNLQ